MKAISSAAALLSAVLLISAARAVEEAPVKATAIDSAAARAAIVGTWRQEKREGKMWSCTFNNYKDDGSFTCAVAFDRGDGREELSLEGTWSIDGNHVSYQNTKSSNPETVPADVKSTDTIISVDKDSFRYIVEDGSEKIEKRTSDSTLKEPSEELGFKMDHIALYQPQEVLGKRVPDAEEFGKFLMTAGMACQHFLGSSDEPENLNIVIAVRPGKRVKVWLDPVNAAHPERAALIKKLEAIPAPEIEEGPVAVAICGVIGGGKPQAGDAPKLPIPEDWKKAISKDKPIEAGELLEKIWP